MSSKMPTDPAEPSPDRAEPHEVELKLGLPTAAAYARLRDALDAAGRFRCALRQENLYLDGAGGELTGATISVRVRVEREDRSRRTVLTVKAGQVRRGAVMDRAEWECELVLDVEALRADPSMLLAQDLGPVQALRRLSPETKALRLLGGINNERRVYRVPLRLPPAEATPPDRAAPFETIWELDRTEFPDGSIDHELEVELGGLPPGVRAELAVEAVQVELARLGVPTVEQPQTKQARFRERVRS